MHQWCVRCTIAQYLQVEHLPHVGHRASRQPQAVDDFPSLPGGASDYNVARNGFALGVDLLSDTLGVLESGDTDLAFTLRERALDAWSTAATQLDVVTIDSTGGHLHASLPIAPVGDEAPSTSGGH